MTDALFDTTPYTIHVDGIPVSKARLAFTGGGDFAQPQHATKYKLGTRHTFTNQTGDRLDIVIVAKPATYKVDADGTEHIEITHQAKVEAFEINATDE